MRVRLPTFQWGEGERRALLVHGLTSSARVWWRVATELADRGWEVTAPDLRGHGGAPSADGHALEDIGADLLGVGGPWEVVVGHSLGGAAVLVAGGETGWAGRLVLVDPVLRVEPGARADFERQVLDELAYTGTQLRDANPDWHPDDVFWKVWSAAQVSPTVVRRVLADNDPWDVAGLLADVAVPTRVLAADPRLGGLVDVAGIRTSASGNPRVHIEPVDGVGHAIFRQKPEVVVAAVVE